MVRGSAFSKGGPLIIWTHITNPNLPASVHFDACAAINNNPSLIIKCGSLPWEQEYRLNDKYMCEQASPQSSVTVTVGLTVPPGAVCHRPPGKVRKRQHFSKKEFPHSTVN
jgi:hypothetical protein